MAYNRGIDFISNSRLIVLGFKDLQFNTNREALVVKIRQFENCQLEQEEKKHAIFANPARVKSL